MNKKQKILLWTIISLVIIRVGRYLMTDKEKEIDLLAKTAWGEARGEGASGMQAVINVILNRVRAGSWYGLTVENVVLKPYQFSCWNDTDPNKDKILSLKTEDPAFIQAKSLAFAGYNGLLADITNGATHYHTIGATPNWAKAMVQTKTIGNHIFYKEV